MAGDTGIAGKVALLLWVPACPALSLLPPAQTLGLAGAQTPQLLVEPPWTPPVVWDRVTLTCQGLGTAGATTWYKDGQRWWQERHDRLNVTESGTYECDRPGTGLSPPVTVLDDDLVLQVPARALLEGDTVTLRCRGRWNSPVTKVRFFKDENNLTRSLNATELSLSPLQLNHSGSYRCKGWVRSWPSGSAAVTVTVHVPVANATITPGSLSHQVHAGDPVTLHCLVQVGSAPVTFTWLRNGQEVARGPLLEFRVTNMGHSGTYQCMATNQADEHCVFRALSPELALEVTPRDTGTHRDAVASGYGGALLFLLLLVGVIVAWHRWHRVAARKNQERAPPDPPPPPEEGEVLYTHVVVTKRAAVSPRATTLQDPQVTYAELRGPQGQPREPGDTYRNVL
ncbi:Fc receptor-like protein 5 isoform X1 [Haemorhous mexicanus]|uniref:Fc receptor-like protein 5 isoform X1 n=1 Tax=Haemorhous mexicanus TaxID=30427 RepID=UPI0028BE64A9|nr:Fc receptor-like protein 5 isoform X1 [Haemorhous mexicanus]